MVEAAEKEGLLTQGATLLEPSSGNTGIGLALVARLKGYHLKVVLPSNVSVERRQLLAVWGAEIIESPGSEGSNGAVRMAERIHGEHPEWVFLYQYANPGNPRAHYEGTGPEIWKDCPEITHFVAGLGTSGTLLGVGRFLKEKNPDIGIWAVEPPAGEIVDGLRNLDDGYIIWTRKLAQVGVFAGISTGAAMAGAAKCARSIDSGVIVIVSADGGWKYLSTGAWTDDIDVVVERARNTIYF
jgi:cysteine synthase B